MKNDSLFPNRERAAHCYVCGCVELDCKACAERLGEPCEWVGPGRKLCSACSPLLASDITVLASWLKNLTVDWLAIARAAGIDTVGQAARCRPPRNPHDKVDQVKHAVKLAAGEWLEDMVGIDPVSGPRPDQIEAAQGAHILRESP